MKTSTASIKTISAILVLLTACCITSAAAESTPKETFVFDLINQYRTTPFAHALSLGYAPAALEEKGITPETVFAPYVLDEELSSAAQDANFRTATADAEAEPPLPVRARMSRTSSVFSFFHFIPMETAARVFVENLFKNELDSGVFQFILSQEFQYAGTAADPGVVLDTRMNAWFLSLVLGSVERVNEMQMLNLINQVRAYPPLTQFFIPIAESSILFQQNPNMYDLLAMQFSPLFPDEIPHHWAQADAALSAPAPPLEAVVITDDTTDVTGGLWPEGALSPGDFFENYPGELFQVATAAVSWQDMTTARPVADLFAALLYSELTTWPYGAVVFSNRYTQAGVAITLETLENSGSGVVSVYAASSINWNLALQVKNEVMNGLEPVAPVPLLDDTAPVEPAPVRIYGLVYFDHDDDLIYSPGEEVTQHTVSVYELVQDPLAVPAENAAVVQTVVTDNAGHFSLFLAPGRQWVFETEKDGQLVRRIIHIEKDHFVKMFFSSWFPTLAPPL